MIALAINFVLVPALAYAIGAALGLATDLKVGLTILGTAAGAPFLPKLVQAARGDVAFGVGLMVLLMGVTIGYLRIVLPLLLPGVEIDPRSIATNLIVVMAAPLAIGLLVRSSAPETAAHWGPDLNRLSGLAILVLLVTGLALNLSNIVGFIGTGGLGAVVLFIAGSLVLGLIGGGRDPSGRGVMGLGSAQRNIAAAILVAGQTFAGTSTLALVLVAAVIGLLILLPSARFLGSRGGADEPVPAAGGATPPPDDPGSGVGAGRGLPATRSAAGRPARGARVQPREPDSRARPACGRPARSRPSLPPSTRAASASHASRTPRSEVMSA